MRGGRANESGGARGSPGGRKCVPGHTTEREQVPETDRGVIGGGLVSGAHGQDKRGTENVPKRDRGGDMGVGVSWREKGGSVCPVWERHDTPSLTYLYLYKVIESVKKEVLCF